MKDIRRTSLSEVTLFGVVINLNASAPKREERYPELETREIIADRRAWMKRCEREFGKRWRDVA